MSSHAVEVVRIGKILPIDGADQIEQTKVWGFTCVIKKGQFREGDLAGWIPPDSIVDTSVPEFTFLRERNNKIYETYRIRGQKFRGCYSQGLLIPARPHWALGQDVTAELKVEHYEPGVMGAKIGGLPTKAPLIGGVPAPEYTEIENFRRYDDLFDSLNQDVVVSSKIHGTNARFVYDGKQLHVGSHHQWKLGVKQNALVRWILSFSYVKALIGPKWVSYLTGPSQLDVYWTIAKKYNLEEKLKRIPNTIVFGEIYGATIQAGFPYDTSQGEPIKFRVFDIMKDGKYLDWDTMVSLAHTLGLETVAEIYRGLWDKEAVIALAEKDDPIAAAVGKTQIQEGVVVKPIKETTHPKLGRLVLKIISNRYLTQKEDKKRKK
jgi:RNA ligase (TIGR02306 family)